MNIDRYNKLMEQNKSKIDTLHDNITTILMVDVIAPFCEKYNLEYTTIMGIWWLQKHNHKNIIDHERYYIDNLHKTGERLTQWASDVTTLIHCIQDCEEVTGSQGWEYAPMTKLERDNIHHSEHERFIEDKLFNR